MAVGEVGGQLAASDRVDAGFERANPVETPERVGNGFGESLFYIGFRRVVSEYAFDVGLVGGNVIARQEDGAARETGFECVVRNFGLALRRGGAGRLLRVRAIRQELFG